VYGNASSNKVEPVEKRGGNSTKVESVSGVAIAAFGGKKDGETSAVSFPFQITAGVVHRFYMPVSELCNFNMA
jgi:hypothetical protein